MIAKQETQRDWPRKFRRSAKATIRCVVSRRNLFVGLVQNSGLQIARGRRLFADNLNELLSGAPGSLRDGIVLLAPRVSDLLQKRFELVRRKVGASEKRFAVGSEHYGERPAGASRCGFDIGDIQAVDVWSLFAVDFDGNEILVQDGRQSGIRERILFHNVGPMGGEV